MDYIEEEPHYLLDSNIISEIIKPQPNFNVLKKMAEHSSGCAICSPVWEELPRHAASKTKKAGKPTQKSDSLIASIALANHMILVTRNTKHFAPIQEVSELKIENWFE